MANEGTSSVDWKRHYQSALLEINPDKLPGRIADANSAINVRIKELPSHPHCGEHSALMYAMRFLRILEWEALEQRNTESASQESALFSRAAMRED
jgi:hypothetical protein